MASNSAREITKWSDQQYVRSRFWNDLGMDMPKSIAVKELADNTLDQISDNRTTRGDIIVDIPNARVQAMDGGAGISQRRHPDGSTHLYLAVGVLHSSDNYETDGSQSKTTTVGVNGVGSSINNFLSKTFICGNVKDDKLRGYVFHDGTHHDEGATFDTVIPGKDGGEYDWVEFPLDKGYYVAAEYDTSILHFDDIIQSKFIIDYVRGRVGELPEGAEVNLRVIYEDRTENYRFTKIPGDPDYVPSWEEQVTTIEGATIVKSSGWTYAFGDSDNAQEFANVTNIVMNSPVQNSSTLKAKFRVEEYDVNIGIPYAFKYAGRTIPRYSDQTKRKVVVVTANVMKVLQKNKSLWNKYFKEAERVYLAEKLKQTSNHMNSYWPAIGSGSKELYICEGFSAAKTLKAMRNANTQAIIALRGKLLNCRNKSLKDALKSDVINQLFTILTNNDFDKIIIATDADEDGIHINMLLLGLIDEYMPHLIKNGKIYRCDSPAFVFTKKGQPFIGGQDISECPDGWQPNPKKGLGGMTQPETKYFMMDPNTRSLIQFEYTSETYDALNTALISCGSEWIID